MWHALVLYDLDVNAGKSELQRKLDPFVPQGIILRNHNSCRREVLQNFWPRQARREVVVDTRVAVRSRHEVTNV